MPNESYERYYLITPAEADLLALIAEGKTAAEIASIRGESLQQVFRRLRALAAKLRAS